MHVIVTVKVHTCYVFFSPEEEVISSQFGSWGTECGSWRSGSGGWTEKWHCALLRKDRLCSRCVLIISCFFTLHTVHCYSTANNVKCSEECGHELSVFLQVTGLVSSWISRQGNTTALCSESATSVACPNMECLLHPPASRGVFKSFF